MGDVHDSINVETPPAEEEESISSSFSEATDEDVRVEVDEGSLDAAIETEDERMVD